MPLPLSLDESVKLINDLLVPFRELFKVCPLKTTTHIESESFENNVEKIVINLNKFGYSAKTHNVFDTCSLDVSYILFWNNRIFQIFISEDSEICGFCFTTVPDPETCLYAAIYELRNPEHALYERYDNIKHELHFSFDIEKGTFIEFFNVAHRNVNNTVRECKDPFKMDEIFRGKVILDIPVVTQE